MIKGIRVLGILLVLVMGVLSLLATTPLPYDVLVVITLNNTDVLGNDKTVYACTTEKVVLRWEVNSGRKAFLTITPSTNINPEIANRQVGGQGSLLLNILDDVRFKLDSEAEIPDSEITGKILPDTICAGFSIFPIGQYEGTFSQILPEPRNLQRELLLYWDDQGFEGLFAQVDSGIPIPCTFDASTDQITCTEGKATAPTFKLEGAFVEESFQGNYQGVGETAGVQTGFQGTFSFKKSLIPSE
jgi:hypothetical protein